jgi:putative membrane protein
MDANDFEMNNIISYATPKVLEESDLNMFDNLDDIYSKVNELQDAANQIQDGSSKLNDGAKTLRNGASTLNDGANELSREINNKLAQYEKIKAEALNKKELENKIAEIVNNEMAEMMPSIKKMAEAEAENAIKNHKEELENSTVEIAMKYTDKAVSDELTKVENGTVLTEEQEKELEEAISKDIAKVLANIDNSKEIKTFETAIEKAIIDEVKKSVGDATKEAVTETLNETKQSLSKNNGLTAEQQKELASVLTTMKPIIQKQVESTVKAGINEYVYNNGTEPTTKMSYPKYVEKMTNDQLEILSSNLTTYTGMISDDTINAIAEKSTVISDKTVENTTTKLETMLATDGATEKAVEDFKNAIAVSVATSLNADADTMSAMEEKIKAYIIEDIKQTLKDDKTINAYAKAELDPKIDSIATSTAKDLANEYTEELANEIAKSLIEKQLSGKISDSDIDKELNKYESVLNAKITEVDNGIATLKSALNQLTDGTQALYNGTIQLADGSQELTDGITKFNEEGIKKIADTVNTDVKDVEDRVKALKDLSEEYKSFAGINEDDEGTVSFITTIDSIKKEDFEKENAQATNGNTTNETVANETISNQDSKNETSNN